LAIGLCLLGLFAVHRRPIPSPPALVWNSPATNAMDSMPLGNGDLGVNVWCETNGDLVFYLGKTDAWSQNGRLLKVGRIRIRLSPNPTHAGAFFRQTLRMDRGETEILFGDIYRPTQYRIWVDAHHPVVRIDLNSPEPVGLTAQLDLWRKTNRRLLGPELSSAFGLVRAPFAVVESADQVWPTDGRHLIWFHRNETSIWGTNLMLQGLSRAAQTLSDPLLHRTFGGLLLGNDHVAVQDDQLQSAKPARQHRLLVVLHTEQTPAPKDWVDRIEARKDEILKTSPSVAFQQHGEWWRLYSERSWIRIDVDPNHAAIPLTWPALPGAVCPLIIGAEAEGRKAFLGDLRRIRLHARALELETIAASAQNPEIPADESAVADWILDTASPTGYPDRLGSGLIASVGGGMVPVQSRDRSSLSFAGRFWLQAGPSPQLNFRDAGTLEAWIKPSVTRGRILSKALPNGTTDYALDLANGLTVTFGTNTLWSPVVLPTNQWAYVAATFDRSQGMALYLNGQPLTNRTPGHLRVDPVAINQRYALQRFLNAGSGRGASAIKFNGSIFNVDGPIYDADFRAWGGPYWFQNTRLAYWPMLASGDFDLMPPLFRMYLSALPLARWRTQQWHGMPGAFFPEAMHFWGLHTGDDYGWNRSGRRIDEVVNGAVAHHYNSNLELLALALEFYQYRQDPQFARETLLPLAQAILDWWMRRFPSGPKGWIVLSPLSALETYYEATDPMPDLAGLIWVLDGLLALPDSWISPSQRTAWKTYRASLPPLPLSAEGYPRGLAPAREYVPIARNTENPELYAVFPYRLFGICRPELEMARVTFLNRVFMGSRGWQQDDIQAAFLGMMPDARMAVVDRFNQNDPQSRFPAFWGPNMNWVPDQDHGGVALMALQSMLLQSDQSRILLFPAWPKEWDVDFKLHAPQNTVVRGIYRRGKLEHLQVTPQRRIRDLVICQPQS